MNNLKAINMGATSYAADYEAIAPNLPGQNLPWLHQFRIDALGQFSTHGFPSPREEEWRYTNVSAIDKKSFTPVFDASTSKIDADWLKQYQLADVWSIILIDGHFSPEFSVLPNQQDEVEIMSMTAALQGKPEDVENYLGKAVKHSEHNFVAYNGAWFTDGFFIHVKSGQASAKPIQCLHLVTQENCAATTRNLLIVEDQASLNFIETYVGADASYLAAAVTEVFVEEAASLTLYKYQIESDKAYHFGGTYVRQSQSARFTHHNFALGGLLVRSDIHTDLDEASECELNGLYLGVKRQHLDNHTRINHLKPNATSREIYKGVLDDRARGVFQGRVIVAEDAQKTDSQMNNRNLLLSNDAEADTKPQLEIYADDVKCGHGVTIGQLDEKSVFYLQSRGVDDETARNMLTFAFANEMVEKVKIKDLHDQVLAQVLLRFPQEGVQKDWL